MSERTVIRVANIILYLTFITILVVMLHNAYFNKHLNVTTACELEPGEEPRPVWEILGYTNEPSLLDSSKPEVDEYERLMQSCKAWAHNYSFLHWKVMPAIGLIFLSMILKQNPKQFNQWFKNIRKELKDIDQDKKGKPPSFGFN